MKPKRPGIYRIRYEEVPPTGRANKSQYILRNLARNIEEEILENPPKPYEEPIFVRLAEVIPNMPKSYPLVIRRMISKFLTENGLDKKGIRAILRPDKDDLKRTGLYITCDGPREGARGAIPSTR